MEYILYHTCRQEGTLWCKKWQTRKVSSAVLIIYDMGGAMPWLRLLVASLHCRSKYDSRTVHVAYSGGQSGTWTHILLLVLQFHHVIFIISIFDTCISFIYHHHYIWLAVDSVLNKKCTTLVGLILSNHCNILNTFQDTMYLSKYVYQSLNQGFLIYYVDPQVWWISRWIENSIKEVLTYTLL